MCGSGVRVLKHTHHHPPDVYPEKGKSLGISPWRWSRVSCPSPYLHIIHAPIARISRIWWVPTLFCVIYTMFVGFTCVFAKYPMRGARLDTHILSLDIFFFFLLFLSLSIRWMRCYSHWLSTRRLHSTYISTDFCRLHPYWHPKHFAVLVSSGTCVGTRRWKTQLQANSMQKTKKIKWK